MQKRRHRVAGRDERSIATQMGRSSLFLELLRKCPVAGQKRAVNVEIVESYLRSTIDDRQVMRVNLIILILLASGRQILARRVGG